MAHTAVAAPAFAIADLPAGDRNLIGLARVSTDAQDAQLQQDALAEAGCGRTYTEKASTRKAAAERPGLAAALDYLRAGDTLVVWKLDRLGRSVKEVLTIADDLHERGIGVRILTGKLTGTYISSGEGKFFFTMMAAFAELERDIIHERTMPGLAAARAQGRNGGRPTVMDADKLAAARARREPCPNRQGTRRQPGVGLPAPRGGTVTSADYAAWSAASMYACLLPNR
jgi:DNA invertase Pin-like site-specific DNA recombinase